MSTSGSTASLFPPGVLLKGRNLNSSPIQECDLTVMGSFAVWDPMSGKEYVIFLCDHVDCVFRVEAG